MINQLRAEWQKVRSLKMFWILLIVAAAVTVGMALMSLVMYHIYGDNGSIGTSSETMHVITTSNWWTIATGGVPTFLQIVLAVFAIMVVTSEYTGNTMQLTLLARPRRAQVWAAKLLLVGVASLVLTFLLIVLSFVLTFALQHGMTTASFASLFGHEFVSGCLLPTLATTLFALFSLGLGFLLRSSTGAIFLMIGFCLILPIILSMAGHSDVVLDIAKWSPQVLYNELFNGNEIVRTTLGLAAWTVVSLGAGLWVFQKKDA